MINQAVENRTTTPTGLSIGTGLAVETLFDVPVFDKERTHPGKVLPEKYSLHIFNVYTLFRNVLSSIQHRDKDELVRSKLVQEQLLNDMYILAELYKSNNLELVFYLPDYTSVYNKYNKSKDSTAYKPYITHAFIAKTINTLKFPGDVLHGRLSGMLPKASDSVLLLTHFAIDLLSIEIIPKLHLLESHTGKVKNRFEWGNKYHPIGKRDLSILPINKRLLYVFGDKTIVKPHTIADRRLVYETFVSKKLTPATGGVVVASLVNKIVKDIRV